MGPPRSCGGAGGGQSRPGDTRPQLLILETRRLVDCLGFRVFLLITALVATTLSEVIGTTTTVRAIDCCG